MKKSNTKHYSAEEWVDFAMQQAPQRQRAEMQRHLDGGCRECSRLLGLWARVGAIAGRERSTEPPESAVRHVRAAFSQMARAQRDERMPLIPRLSFDSLWQPALVGIRSDSAGPRKLLYRAKDISIEMHIESENKSERVNLTGQIMVGSLVGQSVPPIPVVVSGEEGKVASTMTNSFGEFHLSYVPEEDLQVSFAMVSGDTVVIPLGDSTEWIFRRK